MIKQLIAVAVFFTSAITCYSQTEEDFAINKGSWMIGGNGNFRIDSFDGKLDNFSISPTVGYFVAKKLAIGLSQSIDGIRGEKWTGSYALQPFVRYYLILE